MAALTGTVQPAEAVLGFDDRPAARSILDPAGVGECAHGSEEADGSGADGADGIGRAAMVAAMEAYLLRTEPIPDPVARDITALVAEAENQVGITRVATWPGRRGSGFGPCSACSPSTSASVPGG